MAHDLDFGWDEQAAYIYDDEIDQKYAARWTVPTETFLIADGITTMIYGNNSFPERVAWRHSKRSANFIFLDGHSRSLVEADIPSPTTLTPFWNAEYIPR